MNLSNKVAIFGGTGFIGSYILESLVQNGFQPKVLIREKSLLIIKNIEIITGELDNEKSIKDTIQNCDTIIYSVGIIREIADKDVTFNKLHFEYFRNLVDIALKQKVKKIIYISANGVKKNGTGYQSSKYNAERYLEDNFTNWTIFRPSVVFGDPKGKMEFVTQLKDEIIDKFIPAPLFFRINPFKYMTFFKSNPVHVQDLADLVVKSINNGQSNNQIYKVGGPSETSWSGMLKAIDEVVGKRKLFLPVPISIVQYFVTIFDKFNILPITVTQIKMIKENNICDSEKIFNDFGIDPTGFSSESIKYLQ